MIIHGEDRNLWVWGIQRDTAEYGGYSRILAGYYRDTVGDTAEGYRAGYRAGNSAGEICSVLLRCLLFAGVEDAVELNIYYINRGVE